jgi:hypothetical protein
MAIFPVDAFVAEKAVAMFHAWWRVTTATTKIAPSRWQTGCLSSSKNSEECEENANNKLDTYDWDQEETLMVINLTPQPSKMVEQCLQHVSHYVQSFPFAAVLPVQPLQYLPTADGGVDLKFLRKKTDVKSGMDGGIRFFVRSVDGKNNDIDEEVNKTIQIIAKRNSRGQSISKMFAEKLVVQAFVKGISEGASLKEGSATDATVTTTIKTKMDSPTREMVILISLFHKWM